MLNYNYQCTYMYMICTEHLWYFPFRLFHVWDWWSVLHQKLWLYWWSTGTTLLYYHTAPNMKLWFIQYRQHKNEFQSSAFVSPSFNSHQLRIYLPSITTTVNDPTTLRINNNKRKPFTQVHRTTKAHQHIKKASTCKQVQEMRRYPLLSFPSFRIHIKWNKKEHVRIFTALVEIVTYRHEPPRTALHGSLLKSIPVFQIATIETCYYNITLLAPYVWLKFSFRIQSITWNIEIQLNSNDYFIRIRNNGNYNNNSIFWGLNQTNGFWKYFLFWMWRMFTRQPDLEDILSQYESWEIIIIFLHICTWAA